jgi:hypothetical protein
MKISTADKQANSSGGSEQHRLTWKCAGDRSPKNRAHDRQESSDIDVSPIAAAPPALDSFVLLSSEGAAARSWAASAARPPPDIDRGITRSAPIFPLQTPHTHASFVAGCMLPNASAHQRTRHLPLQHTTTHTASSSRDNTSCLFHRTPPLSHRCPTTGAALGAHMSLLI